MPSNPSANLLTASGLSKFYEASNWAGRTAGTRAALDNVTLAIGQGESSGIVGESGSGKSTLARIVCALLSPTAGTVEFAGVNLFAMKEGKRRPLRRRFQMVFQDPWASLNPRLRVLDAVAEPVAAHGIVPAGEEMKEAARVLETVGISSELHGRYPHELSGGQRQRVAIARALSTRPDLLIADEPVSSLDVSIQAQILNLLKEVRAKTGCALMFISHDLKIISYMCETVTVLYAGRVMESGPTGEVYEKPLHPYTCHLLDCIPWLKGTGPQGACMAPERAPQGRDEAIPGVGCPYAPRCPLVIPECRRGDIPLRGHSPGRSAACLRAGELKRG